MAYSTDLRTRVIAYVNAGGSRLSAAKLFDLSEKTVRNWLRLYKESGSVEPRPHGGGFTSKVDSTDFVQYVSEHPDNTLKETGAHFGISHQGVAYNLRKHGYAYKKKHCATKKEMRRSERYTSKR